MTKILISKKKVPFFLTPILLLMPLCLLGGVSFDQNEKINLSYDNVRLQDVLEAIEKQSQCYFVYNHQTVDVTKNVTIKAKNESLTKVLDKIFASMDVKYSIVGKQIILSKKNTTAKTEATSLKTEGDDKKSVPSQNTTKTKQKTVNEAVSKIRISGKITDNEKMPLAGVSVYSSDKKTGTYSNVDGSYILELIDTTTILQYSTIGFKTITVSLKNMSKSKLSNLNVILAEDVNMLNDVVVTGYQNLSKERATGSFGVLSSKQLQNRLETNIQDRIEGMVPGLYMNNGEISIRGLSTIEGVTSPLYVVDGFPFEGSMSNLNAADIVNITVLKDAAAASIYGARAANGVIVITTNSGKAAKLSVNFNASLFITPTPDIDYLKLMNSSDIVDLQQELFNMNHNTNSYSVQRTAKSAALQALYDNEAGIISDAELNTELNRLRNLDNKKQIRDLLMRNKLKQQYSLSFNGGNEINKYYVSMNFVGNRGYDIGANTQNINLNIKDDIKIAKWLTANFAVASSFDKSNYSNITATSYFSSYMPYEMLKDENGDLTSWRQMKSEYELQRLRDAGLYDETYNPISDREHYKSTGRSMYLRLLGGFKIKIIDGLNLDLSYQTERGNSYFKRVYDKNSYYAKSQINDAAQIIDGEIIKNVPDGGQLYDSRGNNRSYTLRGQLNFDRDFANEHHITALAGGEARSVASDLTATHKFGYNDSNLSFVSVNTKELARIRGTQSINDSYSYDEARNNYYTELEDRYVSFYSNIGYTYNKKYTATVSARIDDSNLFGSDPKYRYLPMWSVGGSWNIDKEPFMASLEWINKLALRATYGINGNVVRKVGPFLQAQVIYSATSEATGTRIVSPPNKSLRWEKTAVTNVGVDFAIFHHRLSGNIDYYEKHTTDLLGYRELDPTNAFQSSLMNYGSMINRGIEVGLQSINVRTRDFNWSTVLNFSYNKNKMTDIKSSSETVTSYTNGFTFNKVDYPLGSLFNYRWAGLNPENGTPMVYNKNGEIIKNCDDSGQPLFNVTDVEDLVYAGTIHPKYTIGFNNTFTWKNLSLSVNIIANGGNVMRDAVPMIHTQSNYNRNVAASAKNFWRKSGDEKIKGMMPAADIYSRGSSDYGTLWTAADINTVKADYIKIRSMVLSYNVPNKIFGKSYFQAAKVTVQVQNPFTWVANDRGLDPEAYYAASIYAQRTLPVTPCYIVGVNFTF